MPFQRTMSVTVVCLLTGVCISCAIASVAVSTHVSTRTVVPVLLLIGLATERLYSSVCGAGIEHDVLESKRFLTLTVFASAVVSSLWYWLVLHLNL